MSIQYIRAAVTLFGHLLHVEHAWRGDSAFRAISTLIAVGILLHDLRMNHRVELGSVHDEPEHPHEEDGETEEPESEPA